MKKYHIADVLSLLEVICALTIVLFAIVNASIELALFAFLLGELCDAFDGICARRWLYPDDGKSRWWRTYAVELDQISDIVIGLACLLYVGWRVNATLAAAILILSLLFGFFVQLIVKNKDVRENSKSPLQFLAILIWRTKLGQRWAEWFIIRSKLSLEIILLRRYLYLTAIALLVLQLIMATSWIPIIKVLIITLLAFGATVVGFKKLDRLTQDKTPIVRK